MCDSDSNLCKHDNQLEFCDACVCSICGGERGWIQCVNSNPSSSLLAGAIDATLCKRLVCEYCLFEDGQCRHCRQALAAPELDCKPELNPSTIPAAKIVFSEAGAGVYFPGHALLKSYFF